MPCDFDSFFFYATFFLALGASLLSPAVASAISIERNCHCYANEAMVHHKVVDNTPWCPNIKMVKIEQMQNYFKGKFK